MESVPRIGLRRTQAVNDLLNGIWELRPELKRKITTTILLGLEAFLRECKTQALITQSRSVMLDSGTENQVDMAMSPPIAGASQDNTISDDVEW